MSASLAPECNELKERYDNCFLKWYSESYLRGNGVNSTNSPNDKDKSTKPCAVDFRAYEKCLMTELKKKGIDKLIDEAREDNKENDSTYMKRR